MAAALDTARVEVRTDAGPDRAPHARVEAGEGWARATLYCGPGNAWGPAARAAARLLPGLLGGELPAAVLDFAPGTPPAASEALIAALAAPRPPPPAALPLALLGARPREETEAAAIHRRVNAHARRHGARPAFDASGPRARGRLENYVVSVHGAPIAPALLAEVCGLLADDPAAA